MALIQSRRYRTVVAPLLVGALTALMSWRFDVVHPAVAIAAGVGAGVGLWAYFRHGPGASDSAR
jgi:hypothetical protein